MYYILEVFNKSNKKSERQHVLALSSKSREIVAFMMCMLLS
jgi:hypothetical protein